MEFAKPLIKGELIQRYKRFLADVLVNNQKVTAHCANTGAMLGCNTPGSEVWLSPAQNPQRKLAYTWELVRAGPSLVGINTHVANKLVQEALDEKIISQLMDYDYQQREVVVGKSRLDFMLKNQLNTCYLEVKSVTAAEGEIAIFPDAVTERGAKHLLALSELYQSGHRCVLLFCIQRENITAVRPADHIDPKYGQLLRQVRDVGVELLAYKTKLSPSEIKITTSVPILL